MPQLWALIVAIDEYKDSERNPASGALTDSKNVFEYLTGAKHMGVPEDHIRRLHNSEATRAGIITSFREHLIENCRISKGDAILFYYAGHGSYVKAPDGWTVGNSDDKVEVILPYDEGFTYPDDHSPTYAIPDRTLAALINLAAARHGDNITVVLDCCSSGHGTRGESPLLFQGDVLVSRDVDPDAVAPLPPTLDHDLVPSLSSQGGRRGRLRALGLNHVLLAACKSREQAQGTNGFGGFLTTLWLCAMRTNLRPRTYAEVIKYINNQLEGFWKNNNIHWDQHPQCEGDLRDRIVFEETMIKADHFKAALVPLADGIREFEVEAGEIHGVKEGTGFEIYGLDRTLQGEKLGTANAIRVDGRSSTVRADSDWKLELLNAAFVAYTATITQKPSLKYIVHVDPDALNDGVADSTRRTLSKALLREQGIDEVTDSDEADLEVRIDHKGAITLHRQDTLMRDLPNAPPRIAGDKELDPANLGAVFCGIARFNFHLAITNQKHPFADKVTFEVLRLVSVGISRGDEGVFPLRKVDGSIQTGEGSRGYEVNDRSEYVIALHNHTDVDLYVQILCFDPDEYNVNLFYGSINGTEATLPKNGGRLQIGASREYPSPMTYFVPDGSTESTLFTKVFLTDEYVKLRALQQPAFFGPEATGGRGDLEGEIETKGVWDTILQPITVVRAQV
ncbi:hypothetical protein BDY19DRAFT_975941 [Irpex rosettiformis]|uniref:Uncharacterized protein n=1 Tax=Irpex rosettiformis TaxID=378272 RepID=A0ACB8TP16_9APHY|nr:hypothetical protein BDY19DRAFT_975941 [Irpex rosettiformis]